LAIALLLHVLVVCLDELAVLDVPIQPSMSIRGHRAQEGIVRRASRDTAAAAHSLWFLGAEVVVASLAAAIGALILSDPQATTGETVAVTALSGVVGLNTARSTAALIISLSLSREAVA
jgi:hypothetical protein